MDLRKTPQRAALAICSGLLYSCSAGPTGPEAGTPAYHWALAHKSFQAGHYTRTADHLKQVLESENEFTARAGPWRLVVLAGLSQGYIHLAERFTAGAMASEANSTTFRKKAIDYRSMASRRTVQFGEAYRAFQQNRPDGEILLAFSSPAGTGRPPAKLARVAAGTLPSPQEIALVERQSLRRAVLLAVARAAGSGDNIGRAQELLKDSSYRVSREAFSLAMAHALYEGAMLYGPRKLHHPGRHSFFLTGADQALEDVPQTDNSAELREKVKAAMQKLPSL